VLYTSVVSTRCAPMVHADADGPTPPLARGAARKAASGGVGVGARQCPLLSCGGPHPPAGPVRCVRVLVLRRRPVLAHSTNLTHKPQPSHVRPDDGKPRGVCAQAKTAP